MRNSTILAVALLASTAGADESASGETRKAFLDAFPSSRIACPDATPDDCVCGEFGNRTALPMRYTRFQSCPHPVLEGVRNMKTFTADGAAISWHPNGKVQGIANWEEERQTGYTRIWHDSGALFAELQFVEDQLHGKEIRYSRGGAVETVTVWNHGEPDRKRARALSRSPGIDAPFDRPAPSAGDDNERTPE